MALYSHFLDRSRGRSSGRLKKALEAIQGINREEPNFTGGDEAIRARTALETTPIEEPALPPTEETEVSPESRKEAKRGLFSRIGSAFRGPTEAEQKEGKVPPLTRAAEYIIPALFGAFGGAGILPGLAVGMGAGAGRRKEAQTRQDELTKIAAKTAEQQKKDKFDREKFEAEQAYRKARLGKMGRGKAAEINKEEEAAYLSISDEDRKDLDKMTVSQLRLAMGDPDATNRGAASYVLKLKLKSKPLEDE